MTWPTKLSKLTTGQRKKRMIVAVIGGDWLRCSSVLMCRCVDVWTAAINSSRLFLFRLTATHRQRGLEKEREREQMFDGA